MKYGMAIKINLQKLDKNRLFKGKNGALYLDATVFVDPENEGQYGDHGMITQDVSKEERDAGTKGPILGNVKVFWTGESQPQEQPKDYPQESMPSEPDGGFDDIPF